MKIERKPVNLGEILIAHKMAKLEDVEAALKEQKKTHERLGSLLVKRGVASAEDIAWALANQFNISFMTVTPDQVDPEVVKLIPEDIAIQRHILPVMRVANDLIIVVDDPMQQKVFDDIEKLTGMTLSACLGSTSEILAALSVVYGDKAMATTEAAAVECLSSRFDAKALTEAAADSTGDNLLGIILAEGRSSGAYSIHLDRVGKATLVRGRVEGRLEPWAKISGGMGAAIITRARVLGGIGTGLDDSRSGEMKIDNHGAKGQYYISLVTASNGESIVIVPVRDAVAVPALKTLGLSKAQMKQVKSLATIRRGLIIATGPRGSGKTATLYSIVAESDPMAHKIVAVEEVRHMAADDWLTISVDSPAELLDAIEAALSADPDVLLVQPMPNEAALGKIVEESMQGRRAGIQMPFGDSVGAISYLLSTSVPAPSIAGALAGVISQRYLRKLCPKCKKADKPIASLKLEDAKPMKAVGCPACGGRGYAGRIAIHEVLVVGADLKAVIASKPNAADLKRAIAAATTETMRDRALALYADGEVGSEEISEFMEGN